MALIEHPSPDDPVICSSCSWSGKRADLDVHPDCLAQCPKCNEIVVLADKVCSCWMATYILVYPKTSCIGEYSTKPPYVALCCDYCGREFSDRIFSYGPSGAVPVGKHYERPGKPK